MGNGDKVTAGENRWQTLESTGRQSTEKRQASNNEGEMKKSVMKEEDRQPRQSAGGRQGMNHLGVSCLTLE